MNETKTFSGRADQNHWGCEVTPDKTEVSLRLIVEGKGTWMNFSLEQLDDLIAGLIEERSKLKDGH